MSFVRAQFTLRRLFWVVAIIACLLGFWFVVLEPSLGNAYPASVRNRFVHARSALKRRKHYSLAMTYHGGLIYVARGTGPRLRWG
jgi:branched-subunit amino acid ABC-type transport system permease component